MLPIPNEIWRLVSTEKGSIGFSVKNDIFHDHEMQNSPFIRDNSEDICTENCVDFEYEFHNYSESHIIRCCYARRILQHNKYKELLNNQISNSKSKLLKGSMIKEEEPKASSILLQKSPSMKSDSRSKGAKSRRK